MMSQQNQLAQTVIPVLTLKSGPFKYKQKESYASKKKNSDIVPDENDCAIVFEKATSRLYFKTIDQKLFSKTGEKKSTTLECIDISAADLKVTTKFGCWDSIACRLLVECSQPLVSWQKLNKIEGLVERIGVDSSSSTVNEYTKEGEQDPKKNTSGGEQNTFVRKVEESCMVKVTVDIKDLLRVRDLLHCLKVAKVRERKQVQENHKRGVDKHVRVPSKIREGLPEWVNYIPAKWYSSTIRQVFEYMLMMYTLLTLMWAIWQLYKHVDFIHRFLRPLLELIEFYLQVLRHWLKWLDQFVIVVTNYWWMYMKPVYLLAAPLYAALAQLFKPLRNVAGVIATLTQPITAAFRLAMTAFAPLFRPAVACFHALCQAFRKCVDACAVAWEVVARTTIVRLVIERLQGMGVGRFMQELSNGSLDPLKMQVIMVRDLLIKSMKQIYYGLRFILQRVYYMKVFVQRERDYANEETTTASKKDD